jgi:hypothetical protein
MFVDSLTAAFSKLQTPASAGGHFGELGLLRGEVGGFSVYKKKGLSKQSETGG